MNTAGSVLVDTTVVVAYFRGESALRSRFLQAASCSGSVDSREMNRACAGSGTVVAGEPRVRLLAEPLPNESGTAY